MSEGFAVMIACIWLSLTAYALTPWLRGCHIKLARVCWTGGALALIAHMVLAFHLVHDWSHADAVAATARQSAEVTGLAWGHGVWLNYLMALLWLFDVAVWWRLDHQRYLKLPVVWVRGRDAFFLFMIFNGAVIFEDGAVRILGILVCAWVVLLWLRPPRGIETTQMIEKGEAS